MNASGRERFFKLVTHAVRGGTLVKLTLGKPSGKDPTLKNVYIRPVELKEGHRFAWVWRHKTRDITKNHNAHETLRLLWPMLGTDFRDGHLFTSTGSAQLETEGARERLKVKETQAPLAQLAGNDRIKQRAIPATSGWLTALGVTRPGGAPAPGMADKFRQIERFAEILGHLISESRFSSDRILRVFDMGCGKGYLTFAAAELLGERAEVHGIEVRPDLVEACNAVASAQKLSGRVTFEQGTISSTPVDRADVLIALHACDTATDDALAKGISSGARLLVVAPCCQKEVRSQLSASDPLGPTLRHGLFAERQAEFATDAIRVHLLEWAGFRTRVIEFVSSEHTAKNVMIAGIRGGSEHSSEAASQVRKMAAFYGIRRQALATHLGFTL